MTHIQYMRDYIENINRIIQLDIEFYPNEKDFYIKDGKYKYSFYVGGIKSIYIEQCDMVDPDRASLFDNGLGIYEEDFYFYNTINFDKSTPRYSYYSTEEELFQTSLVEDLEDLDLSDIRAILELKSKLQLLRGQKC